MNNRNFTPYNNYIYIYIYRLQKILDWLHHPCNAFTIYTMQNIKPLYYTIFVQDENDDNDGILTLFIPAWKKIAYHYSHRIRYTAKKKKHVYKNYTQHFAYSWS